MTNSVQKLYVSMVDKWSWSRNHGLCSSRAVDSTFVSTKDRSSRRERLMRIKSVQDNPTMSTMKQMKTRTATTTKVARVNQTLTGFLR
ncbi:hypothetical protein TNCV_122141 [Trichonephila clavipes]|nr:hypothetical protein TNCV_122141 [Trichonephila clavipes]